MFKGPQGMSLAGNASAAASAAAIFAATSAADKTKMCASSLIFRWCFYLASGGYTTRTPHQEKIKCHREVYENRHKPSSIYLNPGP